MFFFLESKKKSVSFSLSDWAVKASKLLPSAGLVFQSIARAIYLSIYLSIYIYFPNITRLAVLKIFLLFIFFGLSAAPWFSSTSSNVIDAPARKPWLWRNSCRKWGIRHHTRAAAIGGTSLTADKLERKKKKESRTFNSCVSRVRAATLRSSTLENVKSYSGNENLCGARGGGGGIAAIATMGLNLIKSARRRKIKIIFKMTEKFSCYNPEKSCAVKGDTAVVSRPSSLSEMAAITAFQLMQYITR